MDMEASRSRNLAYMQELMAIVPVLVRSAGRKAKMSGNTFAEPKVRSEALVKLQKRSASFSIPTGNIFPQSDIMESGLLNANESLRPKSHPAAPD
jgi:hypothetical protein